MHGGHGHTVLVTNSQTKRIVHASSDRDGRPGESRGREEIKTAAYSNSKWDFVLRYVGK